MTDEKLLIRALRGEVCERPPVWLMRQAGRYLPEYRQLRAQARHFLDFCYTPDLAVEATLQPIRRYGLDAAILFSDILVVPDALGASVRFLEGEGPKLEPLCRRQDLDRLDPDRLHGHLAPVYETLRRLRCELPPQTALIGFAGAPWTLAAYMAEGGGSKDFAVARTLARREPELFADLVALLADAVIEFLSGQVEAGAEALQLFDSWAGALPPAELERWVVAPTRRIVRELRRRHPQVPVICFPRGIGAGYPAFAAAVGSHGLSLDTAMPMSWAADNLPSSVCLQGNLDPIALLAGERAMLAEADAILDATRGRPHVFNLGHGVVPQTDPQAVARLVAHLQSAAG